MPNMKESLEHELNWERGMAIRKDDRSTWATGGGLLLGMGIGFFFLRESALAFVFTIALIVEYPETNYNGIKALVLIGWAFLFKTFGHRIHYPHH